MLKIHVLKNEDFDRLPVEVTRGSDVSESMGFANKFTGEAYVRHTAHHDLNKYLVNHELEELMADESGHEDENGIRHKKFRDIFNPGAAMAKKQQGQEQQRYQQMQQEQERQQAGFLQQIDRHTQFKPQSGPLGAFPGGEQATQQLGGGPGGSVAGQLNGGINQISPELKQRLSGFFSGGVPF